jgi:hypothetical protein
MGNNRSGEPLDDAEIARRMEAGIRRALSTPPKPTRKLIGKTKRAKAMKKSRARKKPKS